MAYRKWLLALAFVSISLPAGLAQIRNVKADRPDKGKTSDTVSPFVVGERLNYDVSWSDFIVAGELTVETKDRRNFEGIDGYHVMVQAQSVGIVKAIVYKVNEVYESFINSETLQPFRAEKSSRRGNNRKAGSIVFDRKRGSARLSDGRTIQVPPDTYDVAGLLYAIRSIDLTQGKEQTFTMLDNEKLTTVKINPEAREKLTTRTGKYNVVRVAAMTVNEQKADDSFKIRVFITDDARRLPVLLTAQMSWGEVRAELTSVSGTKQDKKK